MRSKAVRNRLLPALLLIGCSGCAFLAGEPVEIRVKVDCPVLGKEHRLADDGKAWVKRHEQDAPASVTAFLNSVADHNEKVRTVCRAKEASE